MEQSRSFTAESKKDILLGIFPELSSLPTTSNLFAWSSCVWNFVRAFKRALTPPRGNSGNLVEQRLHFVKCFHGMFMRLINYKVFKMLFSMKKKTSEMVYWNKIYRFLKSPTCKKCQYHISRVPACRSLCFHKVTISPGNKQRKSEDPQTMDEAVKPTEASISELSISLHRTGVSTTHFHIFPEQNGWDLEYFTLLTVRVGFSPLDKLQRRGTYGNPIL